MIDVGNIVEFETLKTNGLFVKVPYDIKKPIISLWNDNSTTLEFFSKTYEMEYDTISIDTTTNKETEHKEITLHLDKRVQYKILGFSHKLKRKDLSLIDLSKDEYMNLLRENNITIDDNWIVLYVNKFEQ